eukprot:TRINITY_DN5169_c2_g1_i1.p1 TRINITY_DN5169_c2_g1~~TRINITY_DN5169_c2_g1_i1.p1  ORF type:complete len:273 (+),score=45.30 TRINITY_DN5169_c2_g1_i1:17-835(+)
MGCARSSARTQEARRISFTQVVPDKESQHKDTEQMATMGRCDVKAGWTEPEPNQQDGSIQQVSSGETAGSAAGGVPCREPIPEGPLPCLPGDDCESGQEEPEERIDSKKERSEQVLQEVVQRPNAEPLDKEGEIPNRQEQADPRLFSIERIVSEPKSLISWNSYDFAPCAEDIKLRRSLPPCMPTHKKHLRGITKRLKQIASAPEAFQEFVTKSRDTFDWKATNADAQIHARVDPLEDSQAQAGDSSRDSGKNWLWRFVRGSADGSASSSIF